LEECLKDTYVDDVECQESYESIGGRARYLLAEGYNLVNSEPQQNSTLREGTQNDDQGRIVSFLWSMKQNNAKNGTIITYSSILQKLSRYTDMTPDNVKDYLAKTTHWSESTKSLVTATYTSYLTYHGLTWNPPKYRAPDRLHYIPTEADIDALIAGSGKILSTFLQFLKETGARSGEAVLTLWKDINFERKTVHINNPEKGSRARILPISLKLSDMLNRLPKKSEKVFASLHSVKANFGKTRKTLIYKLQNQRLKDIHLHTFRHWKATMEYHKTKDILHVQRILGHRNINCTLIYITLEAALYQNTTEDYTIKIAKTIDEACRLLEVGFEYVTEMEGTKLFRKRK
jgi:integrase